MRPRWTQESTANHRLPSSRSAPIPEPFSALDRLCNRIGVATDAGSAPADEGPPHPTAGPLRGAFCEPTGSARLAERLALGVDHGQQFVPRLHEGLGAFVLEPRRERLQDYARSRDA